MKLLKKPPLRVLLFSLLAMLAVAITGTAQTQPQNIEFRIGAILASNQNDEFDARLKGLEKQLRVLKYRSYRLLTDKSENIPRNGNKVFEIPGGRSLMVTPQEFQDNRIALQVRLTDGKKPMLDTTVRIANKGNFILGGPPHEGGVLVLSISATVQ